MHATSPVPVETRPGRRARRYDSAESWWRRARAAQPGMPWHRVVAASVAGALTIAVLGLTQETLGTPVLIAAFGSSCVLVFLLPDAPLSRPANVVGGHVVSAGCGLLVHSFLPTAWWSMALAVGLAMAAMAGARIVHPPAGGTPIAIMLAHEGWSYLFTPVLAGALVLTACALLYRWILRRAERARARG